MLFSVLDYPGLVQLTPKPHPLELSFLLNREGAGLALPVLSNLLSGVSKYSSPQEQECDVCGDNRDIKEGKSLLKYVCWALLHAAFKQNCARTITLTYLNIFSKFVGQEGRI